MTVTSTGPIALTERALGPDLARGFMLLFIAVANSHYFLQGTAVLGGFPTDGSRLDCVVIWVITTFVDGRAFPMFGLLFGYGVAQIVRRQDEAGTSREAVRHMLWRRSWFLLVVGGVHSVLLYAGDILRAYGFLLLVLGFWIVRWRDYWLLYMSVFVLVVLSLPNTDSSAISDEAPDEVMLPPDLESMVVERLAAIWYVTLLGPAAFIVPFAIGVWMGRRRVLERPAEHRTLLGVVAGVGITAAVLGAQPVSLMLAGVTDVPEHSTLRLIGPLHDTTGILGGFGYAALIALLGDRLRAAAPRVVPAIAATGQRSLTCYLAQSPVWFVVFTPFLLDLSDELTVAGTALLAVATWVATVIWADSMHRRGKRGPFEVLVRRVTYR